MIGADCQDCKCPSPYIPGYHCGWRTSTPNSLTGTCQDNILYVCRGGLATAQPIAICGGAGGCTSSNGNNGVGTGEDYCVNRKHDKY